ncbi:MAG: zf-HC2 domain-containing protein [Gammaproteobacteria bacterium]
MNASTHAHHETQQLLPWLANGSLSGTELERAQAHVQVCAACRADLAALHTLRAAGTASAPDLDPGAALARLLPQLDAPAALAEAPAPAPVMPGWRARLAANDRSWLRAAVALQFGAIVILGTLLIRPGASPETQPGAYRVLGAGESARSSLVVTFNPDTPEREVRRIVLASGARVVGGPTATGAWLLDTGDAPAAMVARLRAERAVTLAEVLEGAQGQP